MLVGQRPSKNPLKKYDPVAEVPEKVKKHRAIARAARGGCGGLGQLWEALAELREALGELWEGLEELGGSIYKLTPNQPHSGR